MFTNFKNIVKIIDKMSPNDLEYMNNKTLGNEARFELSWIVPTGPFTYPV